jgi:heat shock protein HspQ
MVALKPLPGVLMSDSDSKAHFSPGQVVRHTRFEYRGVVVDVDPVFSGTDSWYEQVARSRPPKDAPWYHVLVDGAEHMTYVAERHLESDPNPSAIVHPLLEHFFDYFRDGRYGQDRAFH